MQESSNVQIIIYIQCRIQTIFVDTGLSYENLCHRFLKTAGVVPGIYLLGLFIRFR